MARRKKFVKDEIVIHGGVSHTVIKPQYIFRNEPVVDLESEHGVIKHVKTCHVFRQPTGIIEPVVQNVPVEPVLNKYQRQIINYVGESIVVDVYDVLDAFSVNDAAVAHAIKKLLAPGQRGVKTVEQDLKEAVASVNRAIDREQSRFLRG